LLSIHGIALKAEGLWEILINSVGFYGFMSNQLKEEFSIESESPV